MPMQADGNGSHLDPFLCSAQRMPGAAEAGLRLSRLQAGEVNGPRRPIQPEAIPL